MCRTRRRSASSLRVPCQAVSSVSRRRLAPGCTVCCLTPAVSCSRGRWLTQPWPPRQRCQLSRLRQPAMTGRMMTTTAPGRLGPKGPSRSQLGSLGPRRRRGSSLLTCSITLTGQPQPGCPTWCKRLGSSLLTCSLRPLRSRHPRQRRPLPRYPLRRLRRSCRRTPVVPVATTPECAVSDSGSWPRSRRSLRSHAAGSSGGRGASAAAHRLPLPQTPPRTSACGLLPWRALAEGVGPGERVSGCNACASAGPRRRGSQRRRPATRTSSQVRGMLRLRRRRRRRCRVLSRNPHGSRIQR